MSLKAMQQIFNEKAKIQRWLTIEAALAKVEASLGIIPQEAAEEIARKAKIELIPEGDLQREFGQNQHIIFATVKCLQRLCQGDTGEYIHWGATSQDIFDTGEALAVKETCKVIFKALREIEGSLIELTEREAETILAGRTHGQHALPTTMGFKTAVWLREISRHIQRLKEAKERILVGQLNGGVGNFASFGEQGPQIEALTCAELGLKSPDISWATARDRSAEFACLIAMIAGTLGKIAHEIYLLQKTEVGEAEEPIPETRVGSSTMPHKRNPISCENALTEAKKIKYYATLFVEGMIVEHERGLAGWYLQRDNVAEMCLSLGDLLDRMKHNIKNLRLNPQRMESNLEFLKGLLFSEAVMLELGKIVGKQTAHTLVTDASKRVYQQGITFKEALLADPNVARHITEKQVTELLNPRNYTGMASKIARDMVALTLKERKADPMP